MKIDTIVVYDKLTYLNSYFKWSYKLSGVHVLVRFKAIILIEIPSASAFDSNGLMDDEPIQTSVFSSMQQEREEPEKIKIWREEQKKRLEEKGM